MVFFYVMIFAKKLPFVVMTKGARFISGKVGRCNNYLKGNGKGQIDWRV